MRKLLTIFATALFIGGGGVTAQESLLTLSNTAPEQMTAEQFTRYDKLLQRDFTELHLVTMKDPLTTQHEGRIHITLPFLPCEGIVFVPNYYEEDIAGERSYAWGGRNDRHPDSTCATSTIMLVHVDAEYRGNFVIGDDSYELFDLTDGLFAVGKSDLSLFNEFSCGNWESTEPAQTEDVVIGPCANIVTKVLVLYTNYAVSVDPNVHSTALLSISQTNVIWANSGINNHIRLAGVQLYNPSYGQMPGIYPKVDVATFKNIPAVQALRDNYHAEIVVLFTEQYTVQGYNVYGVAADIGGAYEDAYALVDIKQATTGRRTFAHEVTHIFGGMHENDSYEPYWARAHSFVTGNVFQSKTRYTVMHNLEEGKSYVDFVSNPNISFHSKPTGLSDRYNALRVNQLRDHVASFKFDSPFHAGIAITPPSECQSQGTATANVRCGEEPYTYEWFTVDYTLSSNWIPAGNTATITTYTPMTGSAYYAPFRVKVTDANNNVTWSQIRWSNGYCHYLIPHAPYTLVDPYTQKAPTLAINNSIDIIPNPNEGYFLVRFFVEEAENIDIDIYDLSGRLVNTTIQLDAAKGINTHALSLKDKLAKGVYLLKIKGKNTSSNQRICIN